MILVCLMNLLVQFKPTVQIASPSSKSNTLNYSALKSFNWLNPCSDGYCPSCVWHSTLIMSCMTGTPNFNIMRLWNPA